VVLAERLKYLFLDTDALIEQAAKCTIAEIFSTNGEEDFRSIETSVCSFDLSICTFVLGIA